MGILRLAVLKTLAMPLMASSILVSGYGSAGISSEDAEVYLQLYSSNVSPSVFIFFSPPYGAAASLAPGLIGCASACSFNVDEVSNYGTGLGYASIGPTFSNNFTISLNEVGSTGEFDGALNLYANLPNCCVPGDPIVATANIQTFLTTETTTGTDMTNGIETDYSFSAIDPPPVITGNAPEPALWPVILGVVLILARKSH